MRIFAVFFVVGLLGCTVSDQEERTELLLSVTDQELSKTDALTSGDEVAVYARIEGTEHYFVEAAKFTTGADGKSLIASPAAYYPETKQAVRFYAYFPYHTGTFSVPTDQSTPAALKQADLCWATTSTTPVAKAIPLAFEHQMARLVVSVNQTPSKITMPNAFSGGTLDVRTGVFTTTTQSDVSTTGNELIVPAQPLTRLVVEVAGKEYPFTPTSTLTLPAGKTTVLNLTLNPISQTVTLAAPVVTTANWTATATTDEPGQAVSNQFTAHWLVADYRFDKIDRIDLTIKNTVTGVTKEYTTLGVKMVAGSTIAAASYTFALSNVPDLYYPYTVSAIKFYQNTSLVHTATVNNSIAHTGAATLGWGQSISLTLSAATASVGASVTSSTFTLTSNVPYTSSYTTGGASAQGTGSQPPYTNYSVTFTYPAQGATAAAARTHTMTITPTVDYTGNLNTRTFTVTQAAVPTALSLSATKPTEETVSGLGNTYTINITANTSWKVQNAVGGVSVNPEIGTGSKTGVEVKVPASGLNTTREVSIEFVTTAGLSGVAETTAKWSGTQAPDIYVEINGLKWAKGNLVADGANGCKIGVSTDCGLYFQFGSLIGWSGGAAATGYDGRGAPAASNATVKVTPSNLHASFHPGAIWPTGGSTTTLNKPYFSVSATPYATLKTTIWGYAGAPTSGIGVDATKATLLDGRYAPMGVGDPCRFYLGAPWRLPSVADVSSLVGTDIGWSIPLVGATTDHTKSMWSVVRSGKTLSGPWTYERNSIASWVGDRYPSSTAKYGECATFETPAICNGTYRIEYHWHLDSPNAVYFNGDPSSSFGTRTHGVVIRCVQPL